MKSKRGRESFLDARGVIAIDAMIKCRVDLVYQTGGIAYHVLNRRVGRLELFEKPTDYSAFAKILLKPITVPAYASQLTV